MEGHKSIFDKARIETALWASKLVLLAIGAISSATIFKVAVIPYFLDLTLSTVPQIWISFKASWVSPLSIYIALNFIIAAILVSSTFSHKTHRPIIQNNNNNNNNISHFESHTHNIMNNNVSERTKSWESFQILREEKTEDSSSSSSSSSSPPPTPPEILAGGEEAEESPAEEGISSMDETWKAIMEASGTKGLLFKRSETFVEDKPRRALERAIEEKKEMRKSETFLDRVSLRRDLSISHEELSRRADALIKKVNDDMRLQRLESEQRFRAMVNRGL